jgi:hypothetical protein
VPLVVLVSFLAQRACDALPWPSATRAKPPLQSVARPPIA